MYEIRYTKYAKKDIPKLKQAKLDAKVQSLIELIRVNPFETPPPYEKLVGDLAGAFSRRINRIHRLIYKIDEEHHAVIILRMWTHYE
ncbi:MAG: Txe/YoeB family addiction module toxin [Bacilli bacterium]|nr:Txe/YoeB family addiction module toxin [Bacilli bacterium]MBN2876125.1 Txe/YoeB family addiction module toxin [Bacilli bacterium]